MDEVRGHLRGAEEHLVENIWIKHALDNATENVMIADRDGFIRYLNHSLQATLSNPEADIRKE